MRRRVFWRARAMGNDGRARAGAGAGRVGPRMMDVRNPVGGVGDVRGGSGGWTTREGRGAIARGSVNLDGVSTRDARWTDLEVLFFHRTAGQVA